MNLARLTSFVRTGLGVLHGSRAFGGPVQANLILTNRCNIRCIHCYHYSPHATLANLPEVRGMRRRGEALPTTEEMAQMQRLVANTARTHALMDEMIRMGTRSFQLSGNGEPFTHPDFLEFVGRAKRAGCSTNTNTNGTLLSREVCDELLRVGFDDLRVSMMAGTAPVYARTHPGCRADQFERLRESFLYLAERKDALRKSRPKVNLTFVLMGPNHDDVLNFARFAAEVKADGVIYRVIDAVGDPGLEAVIPTAEQADHTRAELKEADRFLASRGLASNVPNALGAFGERIETAELYRRIPCYYGWLATRVEVNGDVFPCCRCYAMMGNAHNQDFHDVWHGAAYRQFRREAGAMNRRKTPVSGCDCAHCVHFNANLRAHRLMHPFARTGGINPRAH